jgi:hypothetical protein
MIDPMTASEGFTHLRNGDGSVTIRHRGRAATTLRGARAAEFLSEIAAGDDQLIMARWTGNYRRGNERTAQNHPRNRHGR